ncbi:hypothetical protein EBT31_17795 [bacterium]|nr:hypothetical protein [bacterium]
MQKTAVNAFDWKAYTDEERAKKGDPFADIKRNAIISANVTEGVHSYARKNLATEQSLASATKL